jgi:hypothetical protein
MFPLSFSVTAGVATAVACSPLVVGMRLGADGQQAGFSALVGAAGPFVLTSELGEIAVFRDVSRAEDVFWAVGDRQDGTAAILSGDIRGNWSELPAPAGTEGATAVWAAPSGPIVASTRLDRSATLDRWDGTAWQALTSTATAPSTERNPGSLAMVNRIASLGNRVVAVGTDGNQALVLASEDAGITFAEVSPPHSLLSVASAVVIDGTGIYVGGYRKVSAHESVGILVESFDRGQNWQVATGLPVNLWIVDLVAANDQVMAIGRTVDGDRIFSAAPGPDSLAGAWATAEVVGSPTFIRFASDGDRTYVFGSGVFVSQAR